MIASNAPLYREPGQQANLPAPMGRALSWALVALTVASTSLLGLYVASLLSPLLDPGAPGHVEDFRIVMALAGAYFVSLVLHAALAVAWVYRAWSWLPPEQRWGRGFRSAAPLSPLKAAALLLVPYFGLYWAFVVGGGIVDALERMRVDYPSSRAIVPHRLAIAAPIATVVFAVFIQIPPIAAIPWLLFMRRVEAVTRDFAAERFPRVRLAPGAR